MSADNYHYVGRLADGRIGIWHNLSASVDAGEQIAAYEPNKIVESVHDALVLAHLEQEANPAEYGVSVEHELLVSP